MIDDDAQLQAAFAAFEHFHPAAAAWVRWVQETFQDNSARLAEIEARQQATQEELVAVNALLADYHVLVEKFADLQLLYAARVAVDEAEEGY